MLTLHCQRWREGRARPVPAGSLIDPAVMAVDVIPERMAKPFVVLHHYSRTFPATRLCVGLFRAAPAIRAQLVGVAVFSVPMNNRALPLHTGVPEAAMGAELGRLVLLDDVAGNGESWFVARAFSALRRARPGVEAILSYADPVERRGPGGEIVKPGHVGTVYQALNAAYRGRSASRTGYCTPAGEPVSGRALSKVRLEERGIDYAVDQLQRMGAPTRERFEPGREWIARLVEEGFLRRFIHPGNHTYCFPLTRRARARGAGLTVQPYPKLDTI